MTTLLISAASVLLAVVGIIVGAVFARRHRRQLEQIHTNIADGQKKTETLREQMLAALDLHSVLVTDADLHTSVRRMASEFAQILEQGNPLHLHLARHELDWATELFRGAAESHITIGSASFSPPETLASRLLEMTNNGDEFWASSLVHADFWAHAAPYLKQQGEKIKGSGVGIHRVFVFDTPEVFNGEHAQQQMLIQHESGIHVKYLIDPPFAPRDLVAVRTKAAVPGVSSVQDDDGLHTAYAMQCRIGSDKRVDHIDIWSQGGLQSEMVKRTWWQLQHFFHEATEFSPQDQNGGPDRRPSAQVTPT